MNSLDITSLYRNIRIKKCLNLLAIHLGKIKFSSSLLINTPTDICKHITNMTYFKFNNEFYKQKSGFPIENSVSSVLAGLFLESVPFKYRLLINATYFRYIDDILIFLPQNIKNPRDCSEIKQYWTLILGNFT